MQLLYKFNILQLMFLLFDLLLILNVLAFFTILCTKIFYNNILRSTQLIYHIAFTQLFRLLLN